MSENLTEEQQVEELKKWWKENGRSIVIGAVLGIALIGGWQVWNNYRDSQAEKGAILYDKFASLILRDDKVSAQKEFNTLNDEHGGTIYVDFARLQLAMSEGNNGNQETAADYLQQVVSAGVDEGLKQVAALRLARVYLAQNKTGEAREMLKHVTDKAFEADALAIEGQAALAEGNKEAARIALEAARDKGAADSEMIRYLLLQLDTPNS